MTNAGEIREKLQTAVDRIGERYFVDPATEAVGSETIEHWKVALGAGSGTDDESDGKIGFSTDDEYERAVDRLESGVTPELDAGVLDRFERLNHVLITDGEVANADEVVTYVETLAEHARTFVFLTSERALDEWLAVAGQRVWVYSAADPEPGRVGRGAESRPDPARWVITRHHTRDDALRIHISWDPPRRHPSSAARGYPSR